MTADRGNNFVKVFVQRDFSEGTAVQFQNKFPLELEGKISRALFEQTIQNVNVIFLRAEKPNTAAIIQGLGACLTGFLIYLCFDTRYERCMKKLAQYIHEQNEGIYGPRGLVLTTPMERGLRVIEIAIVNS